MTKTILFTIIIILTFGCPFAALILQEGFEAGNLDKWSGAPSGKPSEWCKTGKEYAHTGLYGCRFLPGEWHLIKREVFWPAGSKLVKNGVYASFDFRLNSGSVPDSAGMEYLSFFFNLLAMDSSVALGSPTLVAAYNPDSVFCAFLLMRARLSDTPLRVPSRDSVSIDFNKWHSVDIFIRIEQDTLFDSLFVDGRYLGHGSVYMPKKPKILDGWAIGYGNACSLPIGSIDIDNFMVATSRQPLNPMPSYHVRPCTYAYIETTRPLFSIDPYPSALNAVRIIVDSSAIPVADSVFQKGALLQFSRPFACGNEYYFSMFSAEKGFAAETLSPPRPLYISCDSGGYSGFDSNKSNTILRTSRNGENIFVHGDTLFLELTADLDKANYCIDLNVSSEFYSGSHEERFGPFDSTMNFTLSLNTLDGYYYKYPHNTNNWEYFEIKDSKDSSDKYPASVFLKEHYTFDRKNGCYSIAMILRKHMKPGLWTINSYLLDVSEGSKIYFPSVYFYINSPPWPMGLLFLLGALFVLAALTTMYLVKKKFRSDQQPSAAWIKTADEIEKYLNKQYADSDLTTNKIAEHFRLSEKTIFNIYQSVKSKSPVLHLREIRIEKACELLKDPLNAVSDIAYRVGFTDPNIFHRNFKKIKHITASQYRQKAI